MRFIKSYSNRIGEILHLCDLSIMQIPHSAKHNHKLLVDINSRNMDYLHLFGEEAELFFLSKLYGFFNHQHPYWRKKELVSMLNRIAKGASFLFQLHLIYLYSYWFNHFPPSQTVGFWCFKFWSTYSPPCRMLRTNQTKTRHTNKIPTRFSTCLSCSVCFPFPTEKRLHNTNV